MTVIGLSNTSSIILTSLHVEALLVHEELEDWAWRLGKVLD